MNESEFIGALWKFDASRKTFATADADGRHAAFGAAFTHRSQKCDQDARPTGADWMTKRDSSAANVHTFVRETEFLDER